MSSSGLPCIPARNPAESSEGETDEPQDGQQVGQRGGVHRRDAERGAGLLHSGRPLQGAALPSVWLPRGGQRPRRAHVTQLWSLWTPPVLTLVPFDFSPSTKPWWKTIRSSTLECWTFTVLRFSKWVFTAAVQGDTWLLFFLTLQQRHKLDYEVLLWTFKQIRLQRMRLIYKVWGLESSPQLH